MFGKNRHTQNQAPSRPTNDSDNPFDRGDYDYTQAKTNPFSTPSRYGDSYSEPPQAESSQTSSYDADDPFGLGETSTPYNTREDKTRLMDRIPTGVRRIIASVAVGATVLTGGTTAALSIDHIRGGDSSTSVDHDSPSELAAEKPLDPKIAHDFEEALKVDDCSTRVTLDQVTATYQRLFGHEQPKADLGIEALTAMVDDQIEELDASREENGFIPLPDSFTELEKDAKSSKPNIPVSTYKAEMSGYLKQFGVQTLFSWNPDEVTTWGKSGPVSPIRPLSLAEQENNPAIRTVLTSAMANFANFSPNLVGKSVRRVVVGDITSTDQSVLGQSLPNGDGNTLLLDTKDVSQLVKESGGSINDYVDQMRSTTAHESSHRFSEALCLSLFNSFRDTAFQSLNGPFKYSEAAQASLEAAGKTPDGARALETAKNSTDRVAVHRPYGAVNNAEDFATSFGELVMYPPMMPDLYKSKADTTVLNEKIALVMTRAEQAGFDEEVEFYETQSDAARLSAYISAKIDGLNDQFATARRQSKEQLNPYNDPVIAAIDAQADQYEDLLEKLTRAMVGTPHAN